MARTRGFSPTLLAIGALAIAGGSAAGLLGAAGPASAPLAVTTGVTTSPSFAVDVILLIPVAALVGVVVTSLLRTGGTALGAKGGIAAIVVVALVLLGLIWVLHLPASHTDEIAGGYSGTGSGSGNGTGPGGTTGSGGHGGGTGSNGTGGPGGSGGGTGGNNTTNRTGGTGHGTNGTNQTGNGTGGTGTGNGSSGTGSNGTGSGGGGASGQNHTSPILARYPPPSSTWPVFVAVAGASLFLGALVLPGLATRLARLRTRLGPPAPDGARVGAVQVFSEAARRLANAKDPRAVIVLLYSQLMARLEPRVVIPTHRTPEEIRSAHLIPLGVRAEVAEHLTRLFEEACYSSHPMGAEALKLARESVQIAEYDLRAARAIG